MHFIHTWTQQLVPHPCSAGGGVRDVFQLEELQLSGQEALMVVVMEYCDLGGWASREPGGQAG